MPSARWRISIERRGPRLTLHLLWRQLAGFFTASLSIIVVLALSDRFALSIL
jgi:hypothetical protein